MKLCKRCRRKKEESEFSPSGKSLRPECKECHNKKAKDHYQKAGKARKQLYYLQNRDKILWKMKVRTFNITKKEYEEIMSTQDGKCGICNRILYRPNIDHCHITGKVRGLLCYACNVGLGFFKDKSELLLAANSYLKRYK